MPLQRRHEALVARGNIERRLEPAVREPLDAVLRPPQEAPIGRVAPYPPRQSGSGIARALRESDVRECRSWRKTASCCLPDSP